MSTITKSPARPSFMRGTRSRQARNIDQHNPYQPLATIYLLRLTLGLKNHLTTRQLRNLFEDQLGTLTGLADVGLVDEEDVDSSFEDDEDARVLPHKFNKSKLIRLIRNRLNALMAQDLVIHAPLFDSIKGLAETLNLNETEQELLVFRIMVEIFPEMSEFFVDHCSRCTPNTLLQYLQIITTRTERDIQKALRREGRLNQLGWLRIMPKIVDIGDKLILAQGLVEILLTEHESVQALFSHFYQACPASNLSLDDYAHLHPQLDVVLPYLKASLKANKPGVNVLIYGPPGTGKTELAKLLAASLQAQLFEVRHTDKDGDAVNGKARFTAYRVAQQLLSKRTQPCIVMFDEAEDVFPSKNTFDLFALLSDDEPESSSGDKAWVNCQLETNSVPTLWIVNKTSGMDKAYLRRFDFSIQLDKMPLPLRRRLVKKSTQKLSIDEAWQEQLAKHDDVTPAQLVRAAAIVELSRAQSVVDDQELMVRVLNASNQLLNKPPLSSKPQNWTTYNLAFTNTSSETPLADIIQGLTRNPRASLCFYGAPGTGKTALGQHIADKTGLPLIMKKASDLLDMYVGQSEKNIAQMFQDAQKQGAILLLDEADSLLSDRREAHRNWEVSQVNEMLTQMERFNGIFICTTNLMERLDAASLRRFDFKIQFNYLTAEQRWKLFVQELTRLGGRLPDNEEELFRTNQQVKRLTQLTQGDFAVISRRQAILGSTVTAERMIEVLTQECKTKGEQLSAIGFVQ